MTPSHRISLLVVLLSSAFPAGCGGGSGGGDDVASTSAGPLMDSQGGEEQGDALAGLPAEPEPEAEPEPTYGDPVTVTVQLQVGSDEGTGTFQLMDIEGELVAEGESGDRITVPAGPYSVSAQITDDDQLVDTPTRDESVDIAETPPMVIVRFPRSRVSMNIRQNGRAVRRPRVVLFPQTGPGEPDPEPIAEISNPTKIFPVSPGRYDAVIRIGNLEVGVSDLVFQEGATHNGYPVNIN